MGTIITILSPYGTKIFMGLAALGLAILAYFKGRTDIKNKGLSKSVDALVKSKTKDEIRERIHAKNIETITTADLSASDRSRMLSTFPDERKDTGQASAKTGKNP